MSPGNSHDELDRFAAALPPAGADTWWVGLSGGLDSSVLLALLVRLRERGATPALRAIHCSCPSSGYFSLFLTYARTIARARESKPVCVVGPPSTRSSFGIR